VSIPFVRSVAGSAVGSGCESWWVRCSVRSESGLVMVVGFGSFGLASRFARRWCERLGLSVRVRFLRERGTWCVSVPVQR
jgi:hypothetical protein